MKQEVFSYYFASSIGVTEYLESFINMGYHIDSFSYQLMPGNEIRYSCVVVASK